MISGVIFDIDGTIYDYGANDKVAVKKLCEFAEKNLNTDEKNFLEVYDAAKNVVKEKLSDGGSRHSRVLYFQTVLELLGKNSFLHIHEMYDTYWNAFLEGMKPFDGLPEFIRKLKDAGKRIALCTDMTAQIQYRKIERLGLSKFIDFMVSSEETGLEKPSRVMFELALKKLNVRPENAAYFGDSLERDIEGAANVGIKPFRYIGKVREPATDIDCVEFSSYREILNSEIFFAK